MARRESQKAVTAKMYRHFAAVTLVSTAALAIATSESASDQVDAEVEARQPQTSAQGKAASEEARPKLVRTAGSDDRTSRAASGWGSDGTGGEWGGGDGSSSYIPAGIDGRGVSASMLRRLKLTPEEFYAMSAEEQQRILYRLQRSEQLSPEDIEEQQQVVAAASLERAGFDGACSDC